MPIAAKKRFGQHFLRDVGVIGRIVAAFAPARDDTVVEIGPGRGALTYALLPRLARLHAVEFDRDLIAPLTAQAAQYGELQLHNVDALTFDFCALAPRPPRRLRIVGNLPYNISTPLLFHLFAQIECIGDMVFMLQKEVVARLAAAPGGKDYGRLSVMTQAVCTVEALFDVAPGAFAPPPKVNSAVVRLTPHATPPCALAKTPAFAEVVRLSFAQRRKTLRNNLKAVLTDEVLAACGVDPNRRAETLTLMEFCRLAEALAATRA